MSLDTRGARGAESHNICPRPFHHRPAILACMDWDEKLAQRRYELDLRFAQSVDDTVAAFGPINKPF